MKIYHDLPGKAFFSIDLELSVLNMFQSWWHWYAGIALHWWALSAPVSSKKQNPEQTASQRETEWNSSCSLELKDLVESQTQTYSFNCASLFMLQLSQAMKCLLKTCSALNPSSPWQSWRVQTSSAQMHFSCADFGSLCNSLPILEYLAYQWHFSMLLASAFCIRPFWKSSPGASSAADDDEEGVKVKTAEALVTQHTIKASFFLCIVSLLSFSILFLFFCSFRFLCPVVILISIVSIVFAFVVVGLVDGVHSFFLVSFVKPGNQDSDERSVFVFQTIQNKHALDSNVGFACLVQQI